MYWAYLIFSYVLHLRAITIIKTNRDKSHLVRKLKRNLNHNMDNAFSYSAISRKVVGKTVHATIPKGNMGYDQCTFPDTVAVKHYFCCFSLPLANIRPRLLVPFFEISLKNSELKITHNTFQDCRVHFFRQPFLKKLYTVLCHVCSTIFAERSVYSRRGTEGT